MEVRRSYNPLVPKGEIIYDGEKLSPNQIIEQENLVFLRPVILKVNDQPLMRKDWDICLRPNDAVYFVELPGALSPLWAVVKFVAYAVAAYAVGYLYNKWFGPGKPTEPAPAKSVYSLTADQNSISLGLPFPEQFGRFKNVPYLAQENYTEYEDQEQYVYVLGIIGVGEYEIEDVYIDETPLSDFAGSSYHIVPPMSDNFTIIPDIVYTSRSIMDQKLSEDFITTVVSAAGTSITKLSFDVKFPGGLIDYSSHSGTVMGATVYCETYTREIDDTGTALTDWRLLTRRQYSNSTPNELRYTELFTLPRGARYEFKINKTDAGGMSSYAQTDCIMGSVKGYGADQPNYGDVTFIEVKLKASEQMSGEAASKINVVCTRKLYPVTNTGFGVTKQTTKSIVDAFAYIVTADNAGQQVNTTLNFSELYSLRTILSDRNNYFSHIFTDQSIAIEACKTIAKCGRCLPIMPGGELSMVRDVLKSVPSQIYTDDDYTDKSLSISHRLRTEDDPTCVEVEYVSEDTWQVQTVLCYSDGGDINNPAKISLIGCTNRQHAYEEGMYLFWDDEKNRTTISMTVGLKGLIPSNGDMIYVSTRQINWSQSGLLARYDAGVATLSEPVNFMGEASGQIIFSNKTGGIYGPVSATPLENNHKVTVTLTETEIRSIYDHGDKVTKFIFGPAISDILRIRVLKIVPADSISVKIEGTITNDAVYDDPGTAPPLEGVIPGPEEFDPDPDPEDFEDLFAYIFGGYNGTSVLQDCDEYTPDVWISKTNIPTPKRHGAAASTIGYSGYIYGGCYHETGDFYSIYLQDCDQYTPDTWTNKTNMPAPTRYFPAASTIGNSGYIYGGSNVVDYVLYVFQDCDEYTPDVWVSKTNMPSPARYGAAALTIGNSGYIYGGNDGVNILQDCDEYTPDVWVSKNSIPSPARYRLAASPINNSGYLYGGGDADNDNYFLDCDEYTLDVWVSKTDMLAPGRYMLAAATMDNWGFIFGGYGGGGLAFLQYCDAYTPVTDSWSYMSYMPSPNRGDLAASTISQAV